MSTPLERLRGRLDGVKPKPNGGFMARCPAHDDHNPSLDIKIADDGRLLVICRAGCATENVVAALGLKMADLFPSGAGGDGGGRGAAMPARKAATVQRSPGCTLSAYAASKRLPLGRLAEWGLSDMHYMGAPAVRIPYRDGDGQETAVRFRLQLKKGEGGDDRFRWKSGAKPCLYGRERLARARERGYVALVEGESDCHTLWAHDEPAVGVPGANNWRDDRDAPELDGIETVYVVVEPDRGGDALRERLAASALRDRVRLIDLGDVKDASGLYLDEPERFPERWAAARAASVSLAESLAAEGDAEAAADWEVCAGLAHDPDIPGRAADALAAAGLAGEARVVKLLYLIVTSRLLPRPASAAVKGPSSGGKSHTTERVLSLFPGSAYYALTAMSERALIYDDTPLSHRMLVIYEAAGLTGDFASYLVRSLLSEGRVRYVTVEKTKDGMRPRTIEREGPTGLLVTTTASSLHPENETRLLSIPVNDTPEQTKAVLLKLAAGAATGEGEALDPEPWHALQRWLERGERRVVVPFAPALAEMIPPKAVRLRRDFNLLLTLIRAHALLHRASRATDLEGRILANLDDYAKVRELVADLVGDGVEASVPPSVRQTVEAVRGIIAAGGGDQPSLGHRLLGDAEARAASLAEVAKRLEIDKASASRRVQVATRRGYLVNREDKRGKPARLVLGDPLPEDVELFPTAGALRAVLTASDRCTVARRPSGMLTPLPPPSDAGATSPIGPDSTVDAYGGRRAPLDDLPLLQLPQRPPEAKDAPAAAGASTGKVWEW